MQRHHHFQNSSSSSSRPFCVTTATFWFQWFITFPWWSSVQFLPGIRRSPSSTLHSGLSPPVLSSVAESMLHLPDGCFFPMIKSPRSACDHLLVPLFTSSALYTVAFESLAFFSPPPLPTYPPTHFLVFLNVPEPA